jgi:hypothetical protein
MTAFLNDHRDRLLLPPINNSSSTGTAAVRQYVETHIVPGLMAADVCRYDVQSNDFITLSFAETVEMVVVELSIRRDEPTSTAAASHPVVHDDDASGTAASKTKPSRKKKAIMVGPKQRKQLDRDGHREESIRKLTERYRVPFHDYAVYPRKCGRVLDTA